MSDLAGDPGDPCPICGFYNCACHDGYRQALITTGNRSCHTRDCVCTTCRPAAERETYPNNFIMRLTPRQHGYIKKMGGSTWVRRLIDREMEQQQ